MAKLKKNQYELPTAADVGASASGHTHSEYQASDADLTAISGLDSSTAGAIASDGAGWVKKTYTQLKTALGLTKDDVGLANVDNTSDASKPVSSAQQTALDGKQPLDSDLTVIAGLTPTTDNFLQAKSSAWASRTPTQVAADLVTPLSSSLQPLSAKGAASGYAPLDASADVPYANLPVGTAVGTTVADGGHTHAALTTGVGAVLAARSTADVVRTSSTVLADITGMVVTLEANAVYMVDAYFRYSGATAGDPWIQPTGTATAVSQLSNFGIDSAYTTGSRFLVTDGIGSLAILGATGSTASPGIGGIIRGVVTTTSAGTWQLQVRQTSASATATTIYTNSWMRLQRIA